LNETIFTSLAQACAMLATWRHDHNTARPYSGLGFQTPGRVCRLGKPRTGQGG
jgi:putative transposase